MRAFRADLRSLTPSFVAGLCEAGPGSQTPATARRRAFTLVELLVAVAIMLVLIGLALLVANSGIVGNARTSSGSDRIAGWLMQSREKAKRDGAPCGIRFIVDPATGFCREAQLIEVPEPYQMQASPAGQPQAMLLIEQRLGGATPPGLKRIFVYAPTTAITDLTNSVVGGDTLSIPSTGTIHRVNRFLASNYTPAAPLAGWSSVEIEVVDWTKIPDVGAAAVAAGPAPNPPTPTYSTSTFGFFRQARPTFGEPPYQVPDTVSILVNPTPGNSSVPTATSLSVLPNVAGFYDVVFAPTGEVQNTGGLGRIVLWTANPEALGGNTPLLGGPRNGGDVRTTYETAGEMRLIVVYTRTGAVAVQPVALPPGPGPNAGFDPYSTTKDGIASGL